MNHVEVLSLLEIGRSNGLCPISNNRRTSHRFFVPRMALKSVTVDPKQTSNTLYVHFVILMYKVYVREMPLSVYER